jgi:class 3 adenylate cyclase/tetratricopeptide (TPR) repeat protein
VSDLINTLASYVPDLIARRLATDPTPINNPITERFPAAVLFADISGFTALTEQMAQRGPGGAEELTLLLNGYFGQLIKLITSYGGDVVKFAGDALIALFLTFGANGAPQPDHLSTVTGQAAQCSLIAQQQLNNYEVAPNIRLSLKLALGAGEVITMHLGGELNRWEFLVTGDPLIQVGLAGGYAQPGDVILSPEAWTLVQDSATGAPLPLKAAKPQASNQGQIAPAVRLETIKVSAPVPPIVAPTLTTEAQAGLRAYIPGAILARLDAGQRGWLAELRRVTVIFVNLPDLDYTMPLDEAQTIMTTLQSAVYRYEGSVNKLSVDDKGVTFIAALGLPPLAHEDDAIRGVQVGLTIQTQLRHLGYRSAIGVTTGLAFCGSVGSDRRREYTMIGDIVNLSARLMQNAPDDILCDSATYRAAQASAALELMLGVDLDGSGDVGDMPYFEEIRGLKVKGKAHPLTVYRPRSQETMRVDRQATRTSMVGRAEERAIIAEQLQALRDNHQGNIIIIEGEAGIGKSRLVEHLLSQARTQGLNTLIGAGSAVEKSTPYYAWRPIFKQLFDLDRLPGDIPTRREHILKELDAIFTVPAEPISSAIEATTPSVAMRPTTETTARELPWQQLAPLLNVVLPLDWPENEITAQMDGKVRADNTQEFLIRLLQQVTQQSSLRGESYVLILEDVHWLDSTSWDLALLAARRVHPLILVIATRPLTAPIPTEYNQLARMPGVKHIILNNLSPEETIQLVAQRLGVNDLPDPLIKIIQTKSAGNPFFSEELVYALRDNGLVSTENGQCHIVTESGDLRDLNLPDTIQGVITSRIDRLIPAQQLTLKVASVIGRMFEYRTLHDIHPLEGDRPHLSAYLETLGTLDITILESPAPTLTYIFKHIITQEVAYSLMLFSQRRELHRAVAEWYERVYADDLSPHYPLMAHHWRRADDISRAINYLEKAGEDALHHYANEEAVNFFSEAIELVQQAEQNHNGGLSDRNVSKPGPTLRLPTKIQNLQSKMRQGFLEVKLGQAYINWVKLVEGRTHLETGLALLGYPAPTASTAKLVTGLVSQIWRQISFRLWPPRQSTDRPAIKDTLLEAARAYEGLTTVYYFANETILSLYAAFRSLNLAEAAGPSPELARGYASVGVIISFIPHHGLAESYCRRALDMARRFDNLPAQAWVSLLAGVYYAGVGHWANAKALLGQMIDISERLGDRNRWDDGAGNLAAVNYLQGNFSQSARLYDDLLALARQRNDTHNQAWALRGQVYGLLLQGKFDEAQACLETLQKLLAGHAEIVDEALNIDLHGLLALVHLRRNAPDLALAEASNALKLMTKTSPTSYLSLPGYASVTETYLTVWESQVISDARLPVADLPQLKAQPWSSLNSKIQTPNSKMRQWQARRACRALRSYARVFPIGQPRAYLWQGLFEWLSGRPYLARELWQKSLSLAERLAMPYDQGLAHYQLGRYLPANHPVRLDHLTQAQEIFTRLEASHDLERVQATLNYHPTIHGKAPE